MKFDSSIVDTVRTLCIVVENAWIQIKLMNMNVVVSSIALSGADIGIKCVIQMVFESLVIFDGNVEDLIGAVRTLLRPNINQLAPTRTNTPEWRFKCIMRLQGRAEDLMPRTYQAFVIIMRLDEIAARFRTGEQQKFLQHLLAHFLMILPVNCFKTELIHKSGIAKCTMFDTLSMFNHSCSPNLISIFDGRSMYLISSRRIQENAELCINYVEFTTENTEERRTYLQENWLFECNCERCKYAGTYNRHPEITLEDINAANGDEEPLPVRRLRKLEGRLKRQCDNNDAWNPTTGAFCIAYFEECSARVDIIDQ